MQKTTLKWQRAKYLNFLKDLGDLLWQGRLYIKLHPHCKISFTRSLTKSFAGKEAICNDIQNVGLNWKYKKKCQVKTSLGKMKKGNVLDCGRCWHWQARLLQCASAMLLYTVTSLKTWLSICHCFLHGLLSRSWRIGPGPYFFQKEKNV